MNSVNSQDMLAIGTKHHLYFKKMEHTEEVTDGLFVDKKMHVRSQIPVNRKKIIYDEGPLPLNGDSWISLTTCK